MKMMIASDIHGSAYWCAKLLDAYRAEGAQRMILLGDLLYHGPRNDLPQEYAPKKVIEMLNGVKNELRHKRGVLSMARSQSPNSAGSQFFIMHQDAKHLDGQYAAFGKVTSGMDVVDAIAAARTGMQDRPVEEQKIASITVDTHGENYPEPNKLPDPYGRF